MRGPFLLALAMGLLSSCALRNASLSVQVTFPAGVGSGLTSVAVEHSDGECADQLASEVSRLLRSRDISIVSSSPVARKGPSTERFRVDIEETFCAAGGRPAGWSRAVPLSLPEVRPGSIDTYDAGAPSNDFRLEAVVQISQIPSGRVAGRLDLRLWPAEEPSYGGPNFPAAVRSAESQAFAQARRELERFLFGWNEKFRLSGYESVGCGVNTGKAISGRSRDQDLGRAIAALEACRGIPESPMDGRLGSALYNLGLVALLSNKHGLALSSFQEAADLHPETAAYRDAVTVGRRIRYLNGLVVSRDLAGAEE